ncbi:MAG: ArsA family ATPase [Thermoplasmataceae archaeon]
MILSFIGKGGVGKTSIAAAYALELAGIGRTIAVSTDFMPSLKYVLKKDDKLEIVELTESEIADKWIQKYGEDVFTILSEFINTDRSILSHIASAPGVAEEFMISSIVDLEDSGKYDYVVWDTAASSATMHLLALEQDFYNHLGRDIEFYLRVKDKFGSHKVLQVLYQWRELANRVWNRLENSHFFVVMTDDDLSRIQAGEIENDFHRMGLPVDFKICNRYGNRHADNQDCKIILPEFDGNCREVVDSIRRTSGPLFLSRIGIEHKNI